MSANWLVPGEFMSHSGLLLPFKIECDGLTDQEIECFAEVIGKRHKFGKVYGIPRGGLRIATALEKYKTEGDEALLIVDDVYTTGTSMAEAREKFAYTHQYIHGAVMFSRTSPPVWIDPVFCLWP